MVQKKLKHTDQEWLDTIMECRSSGLTDKAWCEAHQISRSNFYYHIRRLRKQACEIPVLGFLPLLVVFTVLGVAADEPGSPAFLIAAGVQILLITASVLIYRHLAHRANETGARERIRGEREQGKENNKGPGK